MKEILSTRAGPVNNLSRDSDVFVGVIVRSMITFYNQILVKLKLCIFFLIYLAQNLNYLVIVTALHSTQRRQRANWGG